MPTGYAVTAAASVVGALVLGGCSSGRDGSPDLVVHAIQVGVIGTEGAVPQIRLVDEHGKVWSPDRDLRDPAEFSGLQAGRYVLSAAVRTCDGNCGTLDSPSLRCTRVVHVGQVHELWVRWRGVHHCQVSTA